MREAAEAIGVLTATTRRSASYWWLWLARAVDSSALVFGPKKRLGKREVPSFTRLAGSPMYVSPSVTVQSHKDYAHCYAGEFSISYTLPEGLSVRLGLPTFHLKATVCRTSEADERPE